MSPKSWIILSINKITNIFNRHKWSSFLGTICKNIFGAIDLRTPTSYPAKFTLHSLTKKTRCSFLASKKWCRKCCQRISLAQHLTSSTSFPTTQTWTSAETRRRPSSSSTPSPTLSTTSSTGRNRLDRELRLRRRKLFGRGRRQSWIVPRILLFIRTLCDNSMDQNVFEQNLDHTCSTVLLRSPQWISIWMHSHSLHLNGHSSHVAKWRMGWRTPIYDQCLSN